MPDDDNNDLASTLFTTEPWALETTQNTIRKNWETYLSKHAKRDTNFLKSIEKNIEILVKGTATDKTTLGELRNARSANQKDSATFNKLLGTMQKGNERRNKNFKDLKQSVAESILKGSKQSGGIINTLTLGLYDKVKGVTKGMMNFDSTMGGLAKTVGAVSAIAGGMIAWIANTTETYKTLVNVGQTFAGDMLMMHHKANQAGISLEMLAKVTIKHSKLMAFQIKNGKSGLDLFLDTQLAVRRNIRAFGNYALTLEQVNEFTASYLEQLRIQGRLDKLSNDARILNTTNYMRKLSELSEITGKSRDILEKEMSQAAENISVWSRGQARDVSVREKFFKAAENMAFGFEVFDAQQQKSLTNIITTADLYTGNLAKTDLGGLISSLAPGVTEGMQTLLNAFTDNSPEDMSVANAEFITSLRNVDTRIIRTLEIQRDLGVQGADEFLKMIRKASALRWDAEKMMYTASKNRTQKEEDDAKAAALAGMSATQKMTMAATNFSDVTSVTMGKLKDVILDSLEPAIKNMVGYIGDATVALKNFILSNEEALKGFAKTIGEVGGTLTGDLSTLGMVAVGAAGAIVAGKAYGVVKGVKYGKKGIGGLADIAGKVQAGKAAGRTATSAAIKAGTEVGKELGEATAKKTSKLAGSAGFKSFLKKWPFLGFVVAAGLAVDRLTEGDVAGAGLEIASGTASILPGLGTAASVGIDAYGFTRDLKRMQEEAGVTATPTTPEENRAAREAAGGRWVKRARGKRVWVPEEGAEEAVTEVAPEAAPAAGLTAHELLTEMNEILWKQNEVLMGIAGATGATATNTKKTADSMTGFNVNNLQ